MKKKFDSASLPGTDSEGRLPSDPRNTLTGGNADVVREIAKAFVSRFPLRERKLIDAANAAEENPGVCHSHDLCDANEPMAAAFNGVMGREVDTQSEADCALWSAAWNIARTEGFATLVPGNSESPWADDFSLLGHQEPEKPAYTYFPISGYTVIKNTETGAKLEFIGTGIANLQKHKAALEWEISHRQRQIASLDSVISGQAVSSPEALR